MGLIVKKIAMNQFEFNFQFLMIISCFVGLEATAKTSTLTDFEVFNINAVQPIEPSGLTIKEGQLYTVCDDANAIFKIKILDDKNVEAVVDVQLDATQLSALNLDLEGITLVDGEFFLVSEAHHKLISVKADKMAWAPTIGGVYADAYKAGLFQLYNAGMEAVTYLGDHRFLHSVEREPRGLIEVTYDADFTHIIKQTNQVFDDSSHALESTRKPDLTGLYYFEGVVYALHRNAYMIHELIKDDQGLYQEGQAWSYKHIVKSPEYAYQDMQFGHAEGLAVDQDYFYIVIDNNNNPRLKNPNDKRPLLIKAKRK